MEFLVVIKRFAKSLARVVRATPPAQTFDLRQQKYERKLWN